MKKVVPSLSALFFVFLFPVSLIFPQAQPAAPSAPQTPSTDLSKSQPPLPTPSDLVTPPTAAPPKSALQGGKGKLVVPPPVDPEKEIASSLAPLPKAPPRMNPETAPTPYQTLPPLPPLPMGFQNFRFGDTLAKVNAELKQSPYVAPQKGDGVSMANGPSANYIKVTGRGFVKRMEFQFYKGMLYRIIVLLAPDRFSFKEVYSQLELSYGMAQRYTPLGAFWADKNISLELDSNNTIKYTDLVGQRLLSGDQREQGQRYKTTKQSFLSQL